MQPGDMCHIIPNAQMKGLGNTWDVHDRTSFICSLPMLRNLPQGGKTADANLPPTVLDKPNEHHLVHSTFPVSYTPA